MKTVDKLNFLSKLKAGGESILIFMSLVSLSAFSFPSFRRTLKAIKRMSWTIWTLPVARARTRPVNRIKAPLWIALSVHLPQLLGRTLRSQRIRTRKWTLRVTKATLMLDDGHPRHPETGLADNVLLQTGRLWERKRMSFL